MVFQWIVSNVIIRCSMFAYRPLATAIHVQWEIEFNFFLSFFLLSYCVCLCICISNAIDRGRFYRRKWKKSGEGKKRYDSSTKCDINFIFTDHWFTVNLKLIKTYTYQSTMTMTMMMCSARCVHYTGQNELGPWVTVREQIQQQNINYVPQCVCAQLHATIQKLREFCLK